MSAATGSFPVLPGFLENVAGIIFAEIMPLDWNRFSRFWIPVDVVICAMPLKNISEAFQFLYCLCSWIQSLSPFRKSLYTRLRKMSREECVKLCNSRN